MTTALAFAACVAAVLALFDVGRTLAPSTSKQATGLVRAVAQAVEVVMRLGREGREPGALERRRLLLLGGAGAFLAGAVLVGPAGGTVLALAAPVAVARLLHARRTAYRAAVERDAPAIALAIGDALVGGHSLRGALAEAAAGLGGPGGAEIARVVAELRAGAATETALERLRERCRTAAIDVLVAACLIQRRCGGDLASLLRSLARAFEDERRVAEEARVATAQARLTGMLVVGLPAGGAFLAEVASPGFIATLLQGALTGALVGIALVLQLVAAVLIRRIGRPAT